MERGRLASVFLSDKRKLTLKVAVGIKAVALGRG